MKVLFLDVDGVMNYEGCRYRSRGFIGIDPVLAFRVGKIKLYTGCEIVLSSAWRYSEDGIKEVEKAIGFKLLDRTPFSGECDSNGLRGMEIKYWLDRHPEVTKYAIIDDDCDMTDDQVPHFFQTSWKTGITEDIMNSIIEHLGLLPLGTYRLPLGAEDCVVGKCGSKVCVRCNQKG